jgi:hypothetical protein
LQTEVDRQIEDHGNRLSVERAGLEFPALHRFERRLIESHGESLQDARVRHVAARVDDRLEDDDPFDARLSCNFRVLRIDARRCHGGHDVAADAQRLVARAAELAAELTAQRPADHAANDAADDTADHAAGLPADHAPFLPAGRVGVLRDLRHFLRHLGRLVELRHLARLLLLHVRRRRVRRRGRRGRGRRRRGSGLHHERGNRLLDDLRVVLDVHSGGDDAADDGDVQHRRDQRGDPAAFFAVFAGGFDQYVVKHGQPTSRAGRMPCSCSGMMPSACAEERNGSTKGERRVLSPES